MRVDGGDDAYHCKVLDVTDTDFLIQDISPRTGNQFLQEERRISISARDQGTFVYIESARVIRGDAERGVPYFHIALPSGMLYHQRRRSTRFRIPLRISASGAIVTLFRDDNPGGIRVVNEEDITGRIIDISAGGLRAEFDPSPHWSPQNEDRFEQCAITVPKLLEIHSEAVIRHWHENKRNQTLVCGMELTRMHVTDRRRLERFIRSIAKTGEIA